MEPAPTGALRSLFFATLIATSAFASVVALGGTAAAAAANDAALAGDAEVELTGDASSVTQTVRFEAADTDPVRMEYGDFLGASATLDGDPTATNAAVETTGDDAVEVTPSSAGTIEVTFDWDLTAAEPKRRVEYVVGTDSVPVRLLGDAAATVSDGEQLSPRTYDVIVRTEHAASVTVEDQEIDGTEWVVTVDSVTFEADGYVALYDEAGDVVGVSDLLIGRDEPRESVDVELTAEVTDGAELTAKVHRDRGEYGTFEANEDPLLTDEDGNPATDTAVISVPAGAAPPATPTATPASGDDPASGLDASGGETQRATDADDGFEPTESTDAPDDGSASPSNEETTDEDGAGFTALGLIAALFGAAVVLARRTRRD